MRKITLADCLFNGARLTLVSTPLSWRWCRDGWGIRLRRHRGDYCPKEQLTASPLK